MKTTNYYNTFIEVAEDCPAIAGEIPPVKGDQKTIATLQYEYISQHPYKFTSDDILFFVHATKKDVAESELEAEKQQFFSKGQPCFRASPLTKKYGWGIHSNEEGKIALVGSETEEYTKFTQAPALKKVKAMRSKKA